MRWKEEERGGKKRKEVWNDVEERGGKRWKEVERGEGGTDGMKKEKAQP